MEAEGDVQLGPVCQAGSVALALATFYWEVVDFAELSAACAASLVKSMVLKRAKIRQRIANTS